MLKGLLFQVLARVLVIVADRAPPQEALADARTAQGMAQAAAEEHLRHTRGLEKLLVNEVLIASLCSLSGV